MNSNDVNSVINNLCDKLGTTASKLIPEMAGYQIAKHSIWLVVSLIFIGVAIGLTIRLLWMRKRDGKILALYPDIVRKLDEEWKKTPIYTKEFSAWTRAEWSDVVSKVNHGMGRNYMVRNGIKRSVVRSHRYGYIWNLFIPYHRMVYCS